MRPELRAQRSYAGTGGAAGAGSLKASTTAARIHTLNPPTAAARTTFRTARPHLNLDPQPVTRTQRWLSARQATDGLPTVQLAWMVWLYRYVIPPSVPTIPRAAEAPEEDHLRGFGSACRKGHGNPNTVRERCHPLAEICWVLAAGGVCRHWCSLTPT
jgi:hypothetical protein